MTLIVDASLVVSSLVDDGPEGSWASQQFEARQLAAPHLMPVEAANILRRLQVWGEISADVAALAHADLLSMSVQLFAYEPFGSRIFELRNNLTCYDAWYVAVAEALDAPLATLDQRLSRAPGPTCRFLLPPEYH